MSGYKLINYVADHKMQKSLVIPAANKAPDDDVGIPEV